MLVWPSQMYVKMDFTFDWLIDWFSSTKNPEVTGKQQSGIANEWASNRIAFICMYKKDEKRFSEEENATVDYQHVLCRRFWFEATTYSRQQKTSGRVCGTGIMSLSNHEPINQSTNHRCPLILHKMFGNKEIFSPKPVLNLNKIRNLV